MYAMLQAQGYQTIGETTNQRAIVTLGNKRFDAAIIGSGVDDKRIQLFHTQFSQVRPNTAIMEQIKKHSTIKKTLNPSNTHGQI